MTDEEAEALAVERFQRHFQKGAIPLWIRRSVPDLGDRRPIDLIKEGKIDEVDRWFQDWMEDLNVGSV